MMFEKIKEKALIKAVNTIEKELKQCDFNILRHECIRAKWQALKQEDDEMYVLLEDYEELLNVLERIFQRGGDEQCQ